MKIEIISSIFYDHNAMRVDINYKKKKNVRKTKAQRLNNTFLNSWQFTEEQKGHKNFLETNDNENMKTQNLWDAANKLLRGKFIAILPQETRKTLNTQPNFTPKTTGKRRRKKKKHQQKERNCKIYKQK